MFLKGSAIYIAQKIQKVKFCRRQAAVPQLRLANATKPGIMFRFFYIAIISSVFLDV